MKTLYNNAYKKLFFLFKDLINLIDSMCNIISNNLMQK